MITNFVYYIYWEFLKILNSLMTAVSSLIPAEVTTEVETVIDDIGTKLNNIYHLIPANESLWTIIKVIVIITIGYVGIRATIFIYNKIRGSGGNI